MARTAAEKAMIWQPRGIDAGGGARVEAVRVLRATASSGEGSKRKRRGRRLYL
uniref:Uncharacterized protein n=1 Tax=Oryza sativa subsp. japonica TaxID=39947 RepID=Q6K380_ORYSJ|nr:hypothetical protein [Oryza sativa Japonica Group]